MREGYSGTAHHSLQRSRRHRRAAPLCDCLSGTTGKTARSYSPTCTLNSRAPPQLVHPEAAQQPPREKQAQLSLLLSHPYVWKGSSQLTHQLLNVLVVKLGLKPLPVVQSCISEPDSGSQGRGQQVEVEINLSLTHKAAGRRNWNCPLNSSPQKAVPPAKPVPSLQ